MDEETLFRALADPTRRRLLDLLRERDGRTLGELESHLPMSRFGCMKHLKVLEAAGLVVPRRVGREKHHYLNPVPIRLLFERWVGRYAQPFSGALTALKRRLEDEAMDERADHVFEIWIATTPERLWRALTEGADTRRYYFGTAVESDWQAGSTFRYLDQDGGTMLEGEVIAAEPPRRLVTTFRPRWPGTPEALAPSEVVWEIEPRDGLCRLTLVHRRFAADPAFAEGVRQGWSRILSGLKTLLETGRPLAA
jgi:uncharacterized protein YndB with AHSA1/START domain